MGGSVERRGPYRPVPISASRFGSSPLILSKMRAGGAQSSPMSMSFLSFMMSPSRESYQPVPVSPT